MTATATLKRTPLHGVHRAAGARMVGFAGWDMPVSYGSILEEHQAVRTRAGVFDISHMGEVDIAGPGALAQLNRILTNDLERLAPGEGQYSLMLNQTGGVIDDLIVYRRSQDHFLAVINASKIDEDLAWMRRHLGTQLVGDQSDAWAALAVQGPQACDLVRSIVRIQPFPARFHLGAGVFNGAELLIARTGYTGEDGVELFCPPARAEPLWHGLVEAGAVPCGLGARDSLRLEACYPLNGSDLGPDISPFEAGLGFAVAWNKRGGFLGRDALAAQHDSGPARRLVALVSGSGAPPRSHYPLFDGDARVGEVTSGCYSPTLQQGIALALVAASSAQPGCTLDMEVRGKRVPVVVRKKPLYTK